MNIEHFPEKKVFQTVVDGETARLMYHVVSVTTPLTAISFLTGWSAAYPPAANKFSKSSKDKKRIDFMFLLFLEF